MSRHCPNCGNPISDQSPQALCTACLLASEPASEPNQTSAHNSLMQGQFQAGDILHDRYRVVSLLGRGGMGEVYRVDDLKLKQPVALKMLPKELAASGPRLEALYNEVRRARLVSHPNVCRVHDIGEMSESTFLTMEFIDGEDLGSLLRRIGCLSRDKFTTLARQLCDGVQAGHDQGVLHLDLKPANVMIDRKGNLRIADFGLSCLATEAEDRRRVAGTPAYMAPEQVLLGQASERSDLYAIGLILFEAFTGRRAIPESQLPAIRAFHEAGSHIDIPEGLSALLGEILAPSPETRPASIALFRESLDAFERDKPLTVSGQSEQKRGKQLAALMITDIVGSVALQQRLGTEAYTRFVTRHDTVFKECLSSAPDAAILNETGDGFLVRFDDPADALNTALRLQYRLQQESCEGQSIRIRIGLNMGVVTAMDEALRGEKRAVGMPINLAARIMDLGDAGQILMSRSLFDDARQYVRDHPPIGDEADSLPTLKWLSHGLYEVKGQEQPVEICEVGVESIAPLSAPEDSGKAKRLTISAGSSSAISEDPPTATIDEIKESDVFINYAMVDDSPLTPGKQGWISRFHRNLSIRLEQLYGERVNVGRITPNEEAEQDKIIPYVGKMKAMVPVVSPPFVRSDNCRKLVEAFSAGTSALDCISIGGRGKMLKVVKTPVPPQEIPPRLGELFARLLEYNFFEHDADGRIREFDEAFGEHSVQQYYERMYDLAFEICNVLREFRSTAESGNSDRKKIFLAETTSDLHPARDRLRRELIETGHTVLPDQGLPVIANKLEEEIQHFLNESDLSIHLIGEHYGLVPEGTEESLAVLQNRLAARKSAETGLERIVWMPRGFQPSDQRQQEFVRRLTEDPETHRGAEVLEDTLENLKEFLEDKWRAEAKVALGSSVPTSTTDAAPRIYLICDQRDEAAVEPLEDYFYDQGIEVSLPEFGVDESQVAETHRNLLAECDAAVVYYGQAGKAWVDIKLREILKAAGYRDGRPIEHQTVYVAPPFDRRKERFRSLTANIVRQSGDAFDPSPLNALVTQLKETKEGTSAS